MNQKYNDVIYGCPNLRFNICGCCSDAIYWDAFSVLHICVGLYYWRLPRTVKNGMLACHTFPERSDSVGRFGETLSRTQTPWLRPGATMLDWQLNVFTFFIRRLWAIRAIKKYGDSFIWKRNMWGLRTSLSFLNNHLDCCVTCQYIFWTAGRHVFQWLDLWRWFSRHNYCV